MQAGRVVAEGTPHETVTPELIRRLYGVEADVLRDPETDDPLVVPRGLASGVTPVGILALCLRVGLLEGVQQPAQRLLEGIEQRAEDIAGGRSADGTGTAVVVRWMATGPVVLSSALMPGRLLKLTGDRISPAAFTGRPHTDPLSLEDLGEIDADRIYLTTLNADGEKALAAAKEQPAFARLRAVRTGSVDVVDGDVWSSAAGPLAAAEVLDGIERLRSAA
ncbi:ABC-type Fe3+-hydroxamate transport system substrate-binding protein [Streptomyces sp. B4I13]|uniref:hypothetical protein n=1 Tax=Streptomyces sp. B4I13 TaxID=3042271 RepID=UPI002786FEA6|nr:hypothetical protein [Streptomyces sp. B4I13]MDQ0957313.1 ABC-type Fe3+-hydroxamate transport system substrate-binding protein [Streptomyces sp. B4I13]